MSYDDNNGQLVKTFMSSHVFDSHCTMRCVVCSSTLTISPLRTVSSGYPVILTVIGWHNIFGVFKVFFRPVVKQSALSNWQVMCADDANCR